MGGERYIGRGDDGKTQIILGWAHLPSAEALESSEGDLGFLILFARCTSAPPPAPG